MTDKRAFLSYFHLSLRFQIGVSNPEFRKFEFAHTSMNSCVLVIYIHAVIIWKAPHSVYSPVLNLTLGPTRFQTFSIIKSYYWVLAEYELHMRRSEAHHLWTKGLFKTLITPIQELFRTNARENMKGINDLRAFLFGICFLFIKGKQDLRTCTWFMWLRIGQSSGILWTLKWIFGFHKRLWNSWLSEQLLASFIGPEKHLVSNQRQ